MGSLLPEIDENLKGNVVECNCTCFSTTLGKKELNAYPETKKECAKARSAKADDCPKEGGAQETQGNGRPKADDNRPVDKGRDN